VESTEPWRISSPNRYVLSGIKELWTSRSILFALVQRDISARYRASFFGFFWAIARPLVQLMIFYLVVGQFLGAGRSIENYAIFIFTGLMLWGFISESVISGTSSITNGAGLVTKISFPREILPLAGVITAGFNFLIQIPVLIVAYFLIGNFPNPIDLLALPAVLVSVVFLSTALALTFATINVFARDAQHLVELVMMLLMYLAPVIYSWVFVRETVMVMFGSDFWFKVYISNPFAALVTGFQDSLWPGDRYYSDGSAAPDLVGVTTVTLWLLPVVTFAFLAVSYKFFLKHEPNFAREL
jgi:ABC-2 type transport system permease protein